MAMNFINRVQVGTCGGLDVGGLRELATNHPGDFLARTRALIDDGKFSWASVQRGDMLYAALDGVPVEVMVTTKSGGQRAIQSSAFPVLAGDLTARALQDAYEAVPTIGQELVTDQNFPGEKSTMLSAVEVLKAGSGDRKEGDDFDKIGASERTVVIGHRPRGYMFDITAETMEENQLGDIVTRINKLADIVAEDVEVQTLEAVLDKNSTVYRPDGVAEALYSATARARTGSSGNLKTGNTFADETDVEAALKLLWAMKNERGVRINTTMNGMVCLLPSKYYMTGFQQFNSEMKTGTATTTKNILASANGWGGIQMISSPLVDDINDDDWYLGHFKKQFVRKWKLNMEYVTAGADDRTFLESRKAFSARLGYDMTVGAQDYVYVIKNTT